MIYHIANALTGYVSALNIIRYITFRSIASLLTALTLSLIFGHWFIAKSRLFFSAKSREWTPETHRQKDNTPTMGGLFMIAITLASILLWCNLTKIQVWIFLLCLLSFGALGAWDDWNKITKKKGISAKAKWYAQIGISAAIAIILFSTHAVSTTLSFPFFKNFNPSIGLLFIPWVIFLLVATSNAVNLSDGLDGLAVGSLIPNFATFAIISYMAGNFIISSYLHIPFADCGEIAVIAATLAGTALGFLWYNCYPAEIFMGDVGSLSLGASLALIAIMCKQELLLPISGGLFVIETVSVMIQVFSFKKFGKRIFRMTPIHHHFELLGWPESKVTARFGIISIVLCLLALITLKIR